MKKIRLKTWVKNVIMIIQIIMFIILCGECDNLMILMFSKLFALIVIMINHKILENYTDLFNEENITR